MLKALRSHKFYVPLITVALSVGLFLFYYVLYVGSQRSYADERAFRLLSVVSDQMQTRFENIKNVLAASVVSDAGPEAYLKLILKDSVSAVQVRTPPPASSPALSRTG